MAMTAEEYRLQYDLEELLDNEGYPSYSEILDNFHVHLTNDPDVVAYMDPYHGVMVFNRYYKNSKQAMSVLARHEILHQALKHMKRMEDWLGKDVWDKRTGWMHQNSNIAGDYEISDLGYTKADKDYIKNFIHGLIVEDDHPEWVGWSFEDMYDELMKQPEPPMPPKQPGGEPPALSPDFIAGWNDYVKEYEEAQKKGKKKPASKKNEAIDKNSEEYKSGYEAAKAMIEAALKGPKGKPGQQGKLPKGAEKLKMPKGLKMPPMGKDGKPKKGPDGQPQKPNKSTKIGDTGDKEIQDQEEKERQENAYIKDDPKEDPARLERIAKAFSEGDKDDKGQDTLIGKIKADTAKRRQYEKDAEAAKLNKAFSNNPIKRFLGSVNRWLARVQSQHNNKFSNTYMRPNTKSYGSGALLQGRIKNKPDYIPKIYCYFDVSTSWSDEDHKVGLQAVEALRKYHKRKEIKLKLYYFADTVNEDKDKCGGSTSAGGEILDHIRRNQPDNIIILSDTDLDGFGDMRQEAEENGDVSIKGKAWYIAKPGSDVSTCLSECIHAKKGYEEYRLGDTGLEDEDY